MNKDIWDFSIGIQGVDNLKPSKYLLNLINSNLSIEEINNLILEYYKDKNVTETYICDIVATRVAMILLDNKFELSYTYYKDIHKCLFNGIYNFAGNFRRVNISKNEEILNGDSVIYTDYDMILKTIEYDFIEESKRNYKNISIDEFINNITKFSSDIWQVHPFMEGNTRTTIVFIVKYLLSMGYKLNISIFKDKGLLYRNALVKSNYYNREKNINIDNTNLINIYKELIIS